MDVTALSMTDLADAIAHKRVSAEEAARASLDRAAKCEPALHAFLELFEREAIEQARAIDARLAKHEHPGPLAGVPIALKDNICLSWGRTTCGSRMLEHYRSPYTATAAQRLIDAGAVIIGKTNMDEFAMGSSCENSAFGPTRNPWDVSRVPGGSSGGSAAAVAAGIVPGALGSDTGGSIRQPAGFCGIVGLKPTYGRVSRYGLVAYASSLDQIGPLTRSVRDAALLMQVMAGADEHDATGSLRAMPDLLAELEEPVNRLNIGVPRFARSGTNHAAVGDSLERAAAALSADGAVVRDVDLPHAGHGIAAYYLVATAEASSNLARFDGVRYGRRAEVRAGEGLDDLYCRSRSEGFGPEVQRRIMLGTHALSSGYYDAYYNTALKARRLIRRDFETAFETCDALLLPASPGPAFRLGEKTSDPLALYLEDVYTVGVNLAGLPAVTLRAGAAMVDGRELPVGVQLVGPAWREDLLLRIARMLERSLPPVTVAAV
ncbi:MAG: Asp-tRNA(Asn)/Glu-tRNA(Gln) amidotransferase subunit GatA [Phycisphaeraceae bacterium]|nr:Asp-tRNA(Asn)/Glu-tRNA(Gln) amidotransferase subunit GatA [Phycisphaeraceae bacterium]